MDGELEMNWSVAKGQSSGFRKKGNRKGQSQICPSLKSDLREYSLFQRPRLEPGLRLCIAQGVPIPKSVAAMKKHFLKLNMFIQKENNMDIDNCAVYELAESNSYDWLYLL